MDREFAKTRIELAEAKSSIGQELQKEPGHAHPTGHAPSGFISIADGDAVIHFEGINKISAVSAPLLREQKNTSIDRIRVIVMHSTIDDLRAVRKFKAKSAKNSVRR